MEEWAKTILNVYRYLERVTGAVDKIVMSRATNAFFASSDNLMFNSVMSVSDDILCLTERKIRLINLKIIIEEALANTNPSLAKILVSNFIEKRTCYQSASIFECSLRTYFRKLKLALLSFEKALLRKGYDKKFFEQMLGKESWIIEVRTKMLCGKDDCFELNNRFAKKICMDYKVGNVNPQIHSNPSL